MITKCLLNPSIYIDLPISNRNEIHDKIEKKKEKYLFSNNFPMKKQNTVLLDHQFGL